MDSDWFLRFFVIVASFCIVISESRQTFDQEPDTLEVNPGEDVILRCRIFDKNPNSICNWQKNGYPIRFQNGKYEWQGDRQRGDCSLKVFKADINFDNADWVCQVSPSSFDADDALSSRSARLIVRIPPMAPRIYYDGQFLNTEADLQVAAGKSVRLRCESRGGNPPAEIHWYIDDELLAESSQKNETEVGDDRKWNAISVLRIVFKKEHHMRRLRCVSNHEAYPRRTLEEATRLDILYEPEVRLVKPEGGFQFEANIDEVKIQCISDGNPKPNVFWRKAGGESILRLGQTLDFLPVREGDGGSYFCWAKNEIGTSDELSVTFDVLYAPRKVLTLPKKRIDLDAGQPAKFQCEAEANPQPKLEWLQKFPEDQGGQVFSRGQGKTLLLSNVTYEMEGKWACVATTTIKGRVRKMTSEPIDVEVVGKPQVLFYKTDAKQDFAMHSDATILVTFCSDPKPRSLVWQWGSLRLIQGQTRGRFKASEILSQDPGLRKDCYQATLSITDVISSDSRTYFVTIGNDRGETRYDVNVRAIDPVPMVALVGVIATALSLVLFIIFCVAYTFKSKKCCFKHKGPAFERDTNFRIYPNEHYIAERLPAPPQVPVKDQPLGIPVYSIARPKSHQKTITDHRYSPTGTEHTIDGLRTRRTSEPTYPLPPRSQFALGFRPSGFGTNLRKTPQNLPIAISSSNGALNFAEAIDNERETFQNQLKANTNILLDGNSTYGPRVTDRADV